MKTIIQFSISTLLLFSIFSNARKSIAATPDKKLLDQARLYLAVRDGNIEKIKALIANGADVNEKDWRGYTPLHIAAMHNRKGIVEFLITNGANVNRKTSKKTKEDFPFDREFEYLELMRKLFISETTVACTPLHFAAKYGHRTIAELLIENGAKIDEKNAQNWTPLHYAALGGHTDIATLLLDNGAHIDKRASMMPRDPQSQEGFAPLHCAAFRGHKEIAELLIDKGAPVDAKELRGITPLHYAALEGHIEIAELLIAKGANINAETSEFDWLELQATGCTPLHFAVFNGHNNLVKFLIVALSNLTNEF